MRSRFLLTVFTGTLLLSTQLASAAPLAEEYLKTGRLSEGATALQAQLKKNPADDQARFGLGVIQFFQSFEHLGTDFYEYGLLTRSGFGNLPGQVSDFLPHNPNPKTISYADFRQMLQTWVNDINAAEKSLSAIKDPDVKLPLPVLSIKVNLFGNGTLVDGSYLMGTVRTPEEQKQDQNFVIQFDRGDADWLAGYCNFLCAWGEVLLAIDGQEMFNCTAHLFFEKVETPYPFLMESNRNFNSLLGGPRGFNRPLVSDILAFIHLWRFELKEPERTKAALAHLEDMQRHAKSMWKYYLAETDNENEWIPNPNQTGVLEIKVTQEMVDTWLVVLDEAGEVLQGKKLIPFWRGQPGVQGVNLRRVFTEPRKIDPFLWFQGTAAAPYLEIGTITDFANPELWRRINQTFGRNRFFTLAFWFN